ncbi:MAG: DUF2953 domain-containing protein [Clostridia bacterium]|nr:DUF2953 domain-containing protein [Clostridia bacterium]
MIKLVALIILAIITVLFAVFLFVPMRFGIRYEKRTSSTKLHIYLSFLGILIRIPYDTDPKRKKKKAKEKTKERKEFSLENFRRNIDAFEEVYVTSKENLLSMLSYVREHLSCKEVDFKICFGLDDAAKTGIFTGAVWTSGTLLLKIIDSLVGIESIKMNVYPDFNDKRFEIYFKTILIIQPFRFIIILRQISDTIKYIKRKIN